MTWIISRDLLSLVNDAPSFPHGSLPSSTPDSDGIDDDRHLDDRYHGQ